MRVGAPIEVLGLQEFGDTAAGYLSLDALVKSAPVELLRVETVNPGKLLVLFTGDVASVETALKAGERAAGEALVDRLFLRNVHRSVSDALTGSARVAGWDSVGIFDSKTISSGVEAADRAAKEGDVRVTEIRFDDTMGGRSSVRFTGSLDAVEAAMGAVEAFLGSRDLLVRRVVIPNPHAEVTDALDGRKDRQNGR